MDDKEVRMNGEKNDYLIPTTATKPSPSQMKKTSSKSIPSAFSEATTEATPNQESKPGRKKLRMSPSNSKKSALVSQSPVAKRSLPFEERYKRITTYLEKSLYEKIHKLYRQGEINKITDLVNTAVKEFVKKYYNH